MNRIVLFGSLLVWSVPRVVWAVGQTQYVQTTPSQGCFTLVDAGKAATIHIDLADWPGVIRAARDLQADMERVSGIKPLITHGTPSTADSAILIGTIGKSRLIEGLVNAGKLEVGQVRGQWESFVIQVLPAPLPGVGKALVIAGSDKRGTIYGIYDLSEQIGVSPWYWWAGVNPTRKDSLFVKAGRYVQGPPSVRYRGVFINDEAPCLTGWVRENFGTIPPSKDPPIPAGVANYNSKFYAKIFEALLRIKANYLWPAMWNNAFNEDDSNNPMLADEYGIVMGTSHQEPMLRAQKEWDRRYLRTLGRWNYYEHPDVLEAFWREGIRRNKAYESIITIGLRGADDTPMIPGGTVEESMALLEQIVAVQRKMIAEEVNPDVTKVPQMWCLYKEVLEYYNAGLRVPDEVTLLWPDDNWGNIRRLPTDAERKRRGGAGVYYHFDYVGGPRNYKWVNTNPIPKVWEQMSLAKAYGADRIWIVNVGDFKGMEFPMEYFMHLAWDTDRWTNHNIREYTRLWTQREFGPEYAEQIAHIITQYGRFNGRRKPELLSPATYSLVHYHEADRVVADFNSIASLAEQIYNKLPEAKKDAFYDLVLYPTKACAIVNELYVTAGRNALYGGQGRASTNDLADKVEQLFKADADLAYHYNHVFAGGRWNHFADQVHIGYTSWNDPPRNIMPPVRRIEVPQVAGLGVAVEGSELAWPGPDGDPCLPCIDAFNRQQRYIDVFNRGSIPFEFTASADRPWIMLSQTGGQVTKEQRLWVSVDWTKAPQGRAPGTVVISQAGQSVRVRVESFNPTEVTRETLHGFVEAQGYVSIEAEHFTRNIPAGPVRWERIEDYGRTVSAMTILPVTARSVVPPRDSPCLEYRMYLFDPGRVTVYSIVAPTLNFMPDRGLSYAVSFDDETPQMIEIVPKGFDARNGNREWEESVRNACWVVRSTHDIQGGGYHILKIWMVDPGVVLEKIVVDLGGLRPNYIGPPESFHR